MTDLTVTLAGMTLKNPVVVASGTFGFGHEYGEFYDLSELGGICVKGLTPRRREGNLYRRIQGWYDSPVSYTHLTLPTT